MMRYDPEIRAIAMEALADGITYAWIAKYIGPSTRTMQLWARQDGLPPRPTERKGVPQPDERAAAVQLYIDGWTATDVGIIHKVHPRTVKRWVRWSGRRRGEAPRSETT